MAHLITVWHNTPDTWSTKRNLTTTIIKHLIKSSNKIQILLDDSWVDTELTEPLTKANYEEFGMDSLASVSKENWDSLSEEFEVLTWTDEELAPKFIEVSTDEFSPLERLNQEEEFEILTYSDKAEILELQESATSELVDSGKLFKTPLNDFATITRVEIL